MNAFEAIELYGNNGKLPTFRCVEIVCIVGSGDTNNTKDAIGASFDATSTKVGPMILGDSNAEVAGDDDDDDVTAAIPAIVDAMTLFSVNIIRFGCPSWGWSVVGGL